MLNVLRLVPLSIKISLNHPRLLIILSCALKINLICKFYILYHNHMILSLMHWRNHTQWSLFLNISFLPFSCFLICHSQKSVHFHRLCIVCFNTMVHPQNVFLALLLFSFMWMLLNSELVSLHCLIFLLCLFTWTFFWSTMPSPTWVNQCIGGCIGNITSHE